LFAASLLIVGLAACKSTPQDAGPAAATQPVSQSQQTKAANPPPGSPTSQSQSQPQSQPGPAPVSESLIDQDTTAGVRGNPIVTIVVFNAGKPVQSAQITVTDAKGKTQATGISDDWGEFKSALPYGKYKVKATAQRQTIEQRILINEKTPEIDLKLDAPPS
jgi:hypothetical protein